MKFFISPVLASFGASRRAALTLAAGGIAAAGLGLPSLAQSQALALSTAINRIGRLRALSQRVAKAYAQIVLGVWPEKSPDILATALRIMESNLAEVLRAQLPAAVSKPVQQCNIDAQQLAELAKSAPTKARVTDVARAADALLASAEKAVVALTEGAASAARVVNVAARQRMLSQRMAKAFMFIEVGLDQGVMQSQIAQARTEFEAGLKTLENTPITTPKIAQELAGAKAQWLFYQTALDSKDKVTARRDVATTSERLLEVMDNLANLYDAALKDVLGSLAHYDTVYAKAG